MVRGAPFAVSQAAWFEGILSDGVKQDMESL